MHWIDKNPPIYVWLNDTWLNERDQKIYTAKSVGWVDPHGHVIPYPKRTVFRDAPNEFKPR